MKLDKIDFHEFIESVTNMLEIRDTYTKGHSNRVADYAELIAKEMRLSKDMIEKIHFAGHLHDIGKIGIPDAILKKCGRLTDTEFDIIKSHSVMGYNILKNIAGFSEFSNIVRHHHERWDGVGYPDNLQGEQIPLKSRILSVADAFDAMTSNRVYRRSLSIEESVEELLKKQMEAI